MPEHFTGNREFHGVASLTLFGLAVGEALAWMAWQGSWIELAGYSVLLALGSGAILLVFCAKCPARHSGCAHVLPGAVARRLPHREEHPYHWWEIGVTAFALTAILVFPQRSLVTQPILLILFWLLVVTAAIDANRRVCRGCSNRHCPGRRLA